MDPSHDSTKRRLGRLAWLLDDAISVPGLNTRVGLDGVIGMIPVAGDLVTSAVSAYVIAEAVRLRAPKWVLARMGLNVLIDTVLGAIPIVGDLFDFVWKTNRRNVKMLDAYIDRPAQQTRRSRWSIVLVALVLMAIVVGVFAGMIWLVSVFWSAMTA